MVKIKRHNNILSQKVTSKDEWLYIIEEGSKSISKKDIDDAIKDFLNKGGEIIKLEELKPCTIGYSAKKKQSKKFIK